MKAKFLFQAFVLLAVVVGALGSGHQAQAQSGVQIVMRSLTLWDSIYTGYVDSMRYEKWPLNLSEAENFTVTATRSSGNLSPLILLLDASDNEISRSVGALTSSRPAGNYYILIRPETSEGGTYSLTIRKTTTTVEEASVSVSLVPPSVEVGGDATAIVSLNNVPASGYTSVEFTCSYNPAMIEVGNITANTDLFGADPAVAINGPQGGSFIVAIAGSNGRKATADGAAFTFNVHALAVGQAEITCRARVSTGNNALTEISFTSATLTITDAVVNGTLNGKVLAGKIPTVSLYEGESLVTSVQADENGNFSLAAPAGSYIVVASAEGFLKARGSATLTRGQTTSMPDVRLPAGDIDGNGVIDQFDALTIGMNYNLPTPAAADLNNDANINVLDLELLAFNYRMVGPVNWQ
ncbi:MAG: carboxypeptidase regulatory-like domain-containing protein [Chloroflexi bacterium]|nr:carboxypeptidase regulatory-like domain-containing protein [Chloroflexota bacterium]MCA2002749.1 carboxypeptidase regulatory-like domain-containing protein [Chloroflexota bacterium]